MRRKRQEKINMKRQKKGGAGVKRKIEGEEEKKGKGKVILHSDFLNMGFME
jgi:hypothetical protein